MILAIAALFALAACTQPAPPPMSSARADCRDAAIHAYYQQHQRTHAAEAVLGVLTLGFGGQYVGAAIDDAVDPLVPPEVEAAADRCVAAR